MEMGHIPDTCTAVYVHVHSCTAATHRTPVDVPRATLGHCARAECSAHCSRGVAADAMTAHRLSMATSPPARHPNKCKRRQKQEAEQEQEPQIAEGRRACPNSSTRDWRVVSAHAVLTHGGTRYAKGVPSLHFSQKNPRRPPTANLRHLLTNNHPNNAPPACALTSMPPPAPLLCVSTSRTR